VFTWNNPPADAKEKLEGLKPSYCCYGHEVGEQGTPHLQGFMEFGESKAWSVIHKKMDNCHAQARRGTPEQAAKYCKKGEQPHEEWVEEKDEGPNYGKNAVVVEWGEISQQGKRNDISPTCDMIKEGKTMREVAIDHPEIFVKYHKGLIALQSILIQPRNEVPTVTVLIGGTGTGKSRHARELVDTPRYVWHPQQSQWFDGYAGEQNCIFEEFRGQIPFGMLLSLLDRYDCKVQYKGGMVEFASTNIVLTSPIHPKDWYKQDDLSKHDKIDQLLRRITKIVDLDEPLAKRQRLDADRRDKEDIVGVPEPKEIQEKPWPYDSPYLTIVDEYGNKPYVFKYDE